MSLKKSFPTQIPEDMQTEDVLVSPHERAVRYGSKGEREWQGYKLQMTETVGTRRDHKP